ncbi:Ser-Thr-rich glycosyl-phosphatidyl-inositol-anchored membrane family-domain-containing protein [Aspergillus alliaceus]|uniref:Ser-Thr-rich glycosyl-phosphatidyl-inositol-anchored membrane family-domain-containing protein n=1 Tax=Petromyces alliaceus TaxID=209559 RepID=A0A5N6FY04_PETAA|nr:Ser-Thr-rich glycosyl-phosphatidyl-inositol-anchored membrane family-domain-containing protein [Aspergillus alliaceus]KAB8234911.1 Ser-Thr-rich glycosyl-phosphatidyl-inositol-anchored membrane family-domain-containing protein [Aspergillus alliaceus]KAE8392166.1 Ser-Thr-rich glycosyl-phosphatidyl-inositol-anchored membrane family-domain-containing protein [Aspergillus alliaceus]
MRFFQIASIVAYAASSFALTITSPQSGDKLDFSKPYTIKWTTVGSDPETFKINLLNQTAANTKKEIAKSVRSADGKYTIEKLWDIEPANGYQFNFESDSKENTGILAQSQVFNVTKVADPPKPSKQDFSSTITKPPPSCTSTSTRIRIRTTSRPCIIHNTFSTSSPSFSSAPRAPWSPSSSTVTPSRSVNNTHTSATNTATHSAAAPTDSTAGSASLTIPAAAGSLMLSLFALAL